MAPHHVLVGIIVVTPAAFLAVLVVSLAIAEELRHARPPRVKSRALTSSIAATLPFPDRQSTSFQIRCAHLRSEIGPTPTREHKGSAFHLCVATESQGQHLVHS